MILYFSIINVPLSLWPNSEEKKLASGLFTSKDVFMDVKPQGLSLTGHLQWCDILAGISRKLDISKQGLDIGCDVSQ